MLFDFHQKQNEKKANSVHATYLLTGTKRGPKPTNGTDVPMPSSPFMSSMPEPEATAEEPIKTTTILLVREEELQGAWCMWSPQLPR
jgi:DNA polymerase delta subunit 3